VKRKKSHPPSQGMKEETKVVLITGAAIVVGGAILYLLLKPSAPSLGPPAPAPPDASPAPSPTQTQQTINVKVGDRVDIQPPALPAGALSWSEAVESHDGGIQGGIATIPGVVVIRYTATIGRGNPLPGDPGFTVVVNISA
jgi:hypothetical protein